VINLNWKNKIVRISLLISIFLFPILSYRIGLSSVPAGGTYYLDVPFGTADYYFSHFDNGSVYSINGDTWRATVSENASALMNSAIDSFDSNGGTLHFDVGNFTLSGQVQIVNKPIAIIGSSWGQSAGIYRGGTRFIAEDNFSANSTFYVSGTSSEKCTLYFKDFILDGNRDNQIASIDGILCSTGYTRESVFEGLALIYINGHPLKVIGTGNQNFWIKRCQIESSDKDVFLYIGYNFYLSESYIFNLDRSGLYIRGGFGYHIESTRFFYNYYHGLWVADAQDVTITGCTYGSNNRDGGAFNSIDLDNINCSAITGCTSRAYAGAVQPQDCVYGDSNCDYITIVGNTFIDYDVNQTYFAGGANSNGEVDHNAG